MEPLANMLLCVDDMGLSQWHMHVWFMFVVWIHVWCDNGIKQMILSLGGVGNAAQYDKGYDITPVITPYTLCDLGDWCDLFLSSQVELKFVVMKNHSSVGIRCKRITWAIQQYWHNKQEVNRSMEDLSRSMQELNSSPQWTVEIYMQHISH